MSFQIKSKANLIGLVSMLGFAMFAIAANRAEAQFFFGGPVRVNVSVGGRFASPIPRPLFVPGPFGFPRPAAFAPPGYAPATFAPATFPPRGVSVSVATPVFNRPFFAAPVYAPPVYVLPAVSPASFQYSASPLTEFGYQSQMTTAPFVEQAAYVSPVTSLPYDSEAYPSLPYNSEAYDSAPYASGQVPIAPIPEANVAPYAPHGFVIETPKVATETSQSESPQVMASQPTETQPTETQPANGGDVRTRIRVSADQLSESIASMKEEDAEVWADFLAPKKIITAVESEDLAALTEWLKNYDGVAGNNELTHITGMNGFAKTRQLMRQIVGPDVDVAASETQEEETAQTPVKRLETVEESRSTETKENSEIVELPAPLPEADPQAAKNGPTLATPIKPAE